MAFRALISKPSISLNLSHFFSPSRSFASKPLSITAFTRPSSVLRFGRRHLISLAETGLFPAELSGSGGLRCFSTRPTTSSLNDPSPNWSNRPPKETILLDGCDFEHWLVVMDPPEGSPTRDEIIDSYIKTLAEVIGSEDEARMKIYSVSTRCYFAFGALVPEELSYKIKALPRVRWVLPDSYLDVKNKDYGGEPFIDGVAVPYDPKYHEEWIRNNARANERSRRNDRPRNFDRSRNFERRRENMQNRGDFPNRDVPPMPNQEFQNRDGQNPIPPRDVPPPLPNRDGQSTMPPRDIPQPQYSNRDAGSMPNRDFQGRDGPNRDFQGRDGPNRDFQGGGGYQGGGNAYQGGGGGYQGGGNAYQGGGGAYPGSGNAYQGGGGAAYQGSGNVPQGGGGAAYQGSGNVPQGGGGAAAYQGSGNVPQGGGGAVYQGSGNVPQGGGGAYQGSGYPTQGGGGAYQGSGYPTQGGGGAYQGGGGTYQGNGNTYQGRDMPPLPNREPQ